ncbi:hypothetical protein SAY87_026318 [Trapa incisa]|uniref:X8 domain-containing protein n=1 Tax=Trapa incisa TaxID=236973 RepID=A0AAN7GJ29_9MYRT|nr:hypothetical protein SAY87_026318 [Trapa incisa]
MALHVPQALHVLSPMEKTCITVCLSAGVGTWCNCRAGLPDPVLKKTLYCACGAGANCRPIHQKGPCFHPNSERCRSEASSLIFGGNRRVGAE